MKYLKSKQLFEKKKYKHGLYTKKEWHKFLDKEWTDIRITKDKTISFDVVDDIDSDGKDTEYTYEVYFINKGKVEDIMIQDNEGFCNKLKEEFKKKSNLDNIDVDILCIPEIKQLRDMDKFDI